MAALAQVRHVVCVQAGVVQAEFRQGQLERAEPVAELAGEGDVTEVDLLQPLPAGQHGDRARQDGGWSRVVLAQTVHLGTGSGERKHLQVAQFFEIVVQIPEEKSDTFALSEDSKIS